MDRAVAAASRQRFFLMSALSNTGNLRPYTFSSSPSRENVNMSRSAPVPLTCRASIPGVRTVKGNSPRPGFHFTGGRGISRWATVQFFCDSLHNAKATGRPRSTSCPPLPVKTY